MSEWIDVNDRLPPKNTRILLANAHESIEFGCYGDFGDPWDGQYQWAAENYGYDGDNGKMADVTHWMPLPPPPLQ